ncbi:hypothetical protein [Mycolicibacterium gilvum]|uniref:hypothetical protein n=1 Tax=Mycolicibacterium gilvum TaxID=1804 RepID=UPI00404606B6
MLLPPVVQGPINTLATTVTVLGAVDGATVQVFSNGAPIGLPTVASGLATEVDLGGATLGTGQKITATQAKNGQTSSSTALPETVGAGPSPTTGLPAVAFLSKVHPCVDWVIVGGCIAGATVEVIHAGHRVGEAVARGPQVSVRVHFPSTPSAGDVLHAAQEVAMPDGTMVRGPQTPSLPIADGPKHDVMAPTLQPPFECDMAVLVSGLLDGASLSVRHDGDDLGGYPFVGNTLWANLLRPVRQGEELSAQQALENCGNASGFGPQVGVNPTATLPTPTIQGPICPNAAVVQVGNLRPGATVTIVGMTKNSTGGSASAQLGQARAWAPVCNLQLPPDWAQHPQLVANPGRLYITVSQQNCDSGSGTAEHPVEPLPGIAEQPGLTSPTECARLVAAHSLTPGAVVVVVSDQADAPVLSTPMFASATTAAIPLYRTLRAGEFIKIVQSGCNAAGESPATEVQEFHALPEPRVVGPVRIPHGGVNLADLLVGSRVHLFVRNALAASFDATDEKMFVPMPGLPLEAAITARQAMCTKISEEGNSELTELGRLTVRHLPPAATRTKPSVVTVSAGDADTGNTVAGQVKIGAAIVGSTGQPFTFTFPSGAVLPSVVVAKDYASEPITWDLVTPPPPPTPMLRLSLVNQAPAYFTITGVQWEIYKQQLDGTLSPVATPTGLAPALTLPSTGNHHIWAGVAVTDLVNGTDVLADFRGNAVIDGVSRLVFSWNNTDRVQQFRLFAETQTIWAGGGAYTHIYPVVAPL